MLHIQPKYPLIDSSCLSRILQRKWERWLVLGIYFLEYEHWYFKWRPCLCGMKGIEISLQFEFWNACILTLPLHLSKHAHFLENFLGLLAKPIPTAIKDGLACSQSFSHSLGAIFWFGVIKKIGLFFKDGTLPPSSIKHLFSWLSYRLSVL